MRFLHYWAFSYPFKPLSLLLNIVYMAYQTIAYKAKKTQKNGDTMEENQMANPEEQQAPVQEVQEEVMEDDDSLPFPRARIVRIMKEEIGNSKQVRSEVKDAMNIWLGNLLKRISREMGNTQFGSVGIADFQRATKPYDMITDIVKDQERLMLSVQKLNADSEHIGRELTRFFEVIQGKQE
jgi:hypothetical protein